MYIKVVRPLTWKKLIPLNILNNHNCEKKPVHVVARLIDH